MQIVEKKTFSSDDNSCSYTEGNSLVFFDGGSLPIEKAKKALEFLIELNKNFPLDKD